jgi:hypothetical protein
MVMWYGLVACRLPGVSRNLRTIGSLAIGPHRSSICSPVTHARSHRRAKTETPIPLLPRARHGKLTSAQPVPLHPVPSRPCLTVCI